MPGEGQEENIALQALKFVFRNGNRETINVGRSGDVRISGTGINNKHCELKLVCDDQSGALKLAIRDASTTGTRLASLGKTADEADGLPQNAITPLLSGATVVLPRTRTQNEPHTFLILHAEEES